RPVLGRLDSILVRQLRRDVAQLRNRLQRQARAPRLVLRLRLAPQVDLPAGEMGREAHILSLLADGKRELIVGDDHLHGASVLVHDDFRHCGGRQRAAHVLGGVPPPHHQVEPPPPPVPPPPPPPPAAPTDARAPPH